MTGETLLARKLVIATGGASFPQTGSDGSFISVLQNDLSIKIEPLKPALVPVYVENYIYSDISGVSIGDARLSFGKTSVRDSLLFTHKNLSGPAALHISQYVKAGDRITADFLPYLTFEAVLEQLKKDHSGNSKGPANYLAQKFEIPKAFANILCDEAVIKACKFSSLSHRELSRIAELLKRHEFSVSGTGGFKEAMVTAGGVSLSEVKLSDMSLKNHPNIRIIGEALDINGDTGGYNLQFEYSSAMAALY